MISASGHSAFQLDFGSNPVDPYGWDGQVRDLLFAQGASVSGQLAQQLGLRTMAQAAAPKEVANSKLRRLLADNKPLNYANVDIGGSVLFSKAQNPKSQPTWREPACILDIDSTGATARYQSQIFNVAG